MKMPQTAKIADPIPFRPFASYHATRGHPHPALFGVSGRLGHGRRDCGPPELNRWRAICRIANGHNAWLGSHLRQLSARRPISYVFEEMVGRDLHEVLRDGAHLAPEPGNAAAGEALWKTIQQVYFALRDK
jgi:hypothetical protein